MYNKVVVRKTIKIIEVIGMEIGITMEDKFYDMKGCRIENNKLNDLKEPVILDRHGYIRNEKFVCFPPFNIEFIGLVCLKRTFGFKCAEEKELIKYLIEDDYPETLRNNKMFKLTEKQSVIYDIEKIGEELRSLGYSIVLDKYNCDINIWDWNVKLKNGDIIEVQHMEDIHYRNVNVEFLKRKLSKWKDILIKTKSGEYEIFSR